MNIGTTGGKINVSALNTSLTGYRRGLLLLPAVLNCHLWDLQSDV